MGRLSMFKAPGMGEKGLMKQGGESHEYTLVLQPNILSQDCCIQEDLPDTTTSGGVSMATRTGAGTRRFGMFKFRITGLPPTAQVQSAILTMTPAFTSASNRNFPLYAILSAADGWTHSSTWNYKHPSTVRWTGDVGNDGGSDAGCSVDGVDRNAASLGNLVYIANSSVGTLHNFTLPLSLIEQWRAGANYGLQLNGADTVSRAWNAAENSTVAYRPKLTIVYKVPFAVRNFLGFGDSKTLGNVGSSYIDYMPTKWVEIPQRIAEGGATAASRAATVVADLASMAACGIPEYALLNLGANETNAMPAEADFKTNYNTIIDTIEATYSGIKIRVMRPWRKNFAAECNTLAGWIADIVAAQGGNVALGPDERIFLEGGDDGATYTVEGIHPNAVGAALTAAQWLTVM